ncbi:hypothetical protein TNCV_1052691 [Trichonephila clavipes]|nr:hypothetical protein TNCV_1052691 [Trichonephila clavipes]
MKTSCVEFISAHLTLHLWNVIIDDLCCSKDLSALAVETKEKRNRFEQTSRTLQRKISMRSTKDQLVEKDVLMPVKHNVFLWNLPDVEEMPSHDGETV